MMSIDEIKVGLLVSDLSIAKDLSLNLREHDIYASVYLNLDSFLLDVKNNKIDFAIADVKSIAASTLSVSNFLKKYAMRIAFFYGEDSRKYIGQILNYDHYGIIKNNIDLGSQIKSALKLVYKEMNLDRKLSFTQTKLREVSRDLSRVEKKSISQYEAINSYEVIGNFLRQIKREEGDFLSSLVKSLEQWQICESYTILNISNGKIESLPLKQKKYKVLGSMPIAENFDVSKEYLEMLTNAYEDDFVHKPICMKLNFEANLLLLGQFSPALKAQGAIDYLSNTLCLSSIEQTSISQYQSTHFMEFLDKIDKSFFHKKDLDKKYLTIDLRNFRSFVESAQSSKLYFHKFMNAFINAISSHATLEFEVITNGFEAIYVGVKPLQIKEAYDYLKEKINDFPYWNYLENSTIILAQKHYPTLMLTGLSSSSILRSTHLSKDFSSVLQKGN
ncbi:MAG: hypothetical protein N4A33_05270 [Bacteriovoracaceae bacterium]|jgi:hypothetical protein|nr:hypothetical protein [Bacteriovoracaceae bacterium]